MGCNTRRAIYAHRHAPHLPHYSPSSEWSEGRRVSALCGYDALSHSTSRISLSPSRRYRSGCRHLRLPSPLATCAAGLKNASQTLYSPSLHHGGCSIYGRYNHSASLSLGYSPS